jgi:hypothetical protein
MPLGIFTGLPLWTDCVGKGGYLPLILPLASAVGLGLSRYRRWDTSFCRLCILFGHGQLYCGNAVETTSGALGERKGGVTELSFKLSLVATHPSMII